MNPAFRNPKSEIRNFLPRVPSGLRLNGGFTLVELLVVVSIIVILIAILLPSMEQAVAVAQRAKCLANLKGAGSGLSLYHQDYNARYPQLASAGAWYGLMGKLNALNGYNGGYLPAGDRPLNPYLGVSAAKGVDQPVPIASCPSDLGDPDYVPNHYEAYGNSYMPAAFSNFFRADPLFYAVGGPAVSWTRLSGGASRKLVMGDWVWHGNRLNSHPQTRWHGSDPDLREHNYLLADGHAEHLKVLPADIETAYGWTYAGGNEGNNGWIWW